MFLCKLDISLAAVLCPWHPNYPRKLQPIPQWYSHYCFVRGRLHSVVRNQMYSTIALSFFVRIFISIFLRGSQCLSLAPGLIFYILMNEKRKLMRYTYIQNLLITYNKGITAAEGAFLYSAKENIVTIEVHMLTST
jgi:hypothetical protein